MFDDTDEVLGAGAREGEQPPPWLLSLVGAVRERLTRSICEYSPVEQIRYYWCDAPEVAGQDDGTQINFYPAIHPDSLQDEQGFLIDVVGLLTTLDKTHAVDWVHRYCPVHAASSCFLRIAGVYNSNRVELCLAGLATTLIEGNL
jgi:hypothetical protein